MYIANCREMAVGSWLFLAPMTGLQVSTVVAIARNIYLNWFKFTPSLWSLMSASKYTVILRFSKDAGEDKANGLELRKTNCG